MKTKNALLIVLTGILALAPALDSLAGVPDSGQKNYLEGRPRATSRR